PVHVIPPVSAARWPRCCGGRCRRPRRCWPPPAGRGSARASGPPATWAGSSGARPRLAWTRWCWGPAGPDRCTGARGRCGRVGGIVAPRCADPLYRRAVKVSMGAVFAVPYARLADWRGGLSLLRRAGFRLLALTPDQSATPIGTAEPGERAALLLGTEGDGLSSRWLAEADEAVCIPMAPGAMAAGVDSLNVVAAAAIACCLFAGGAG